MIQVRFAGFGGQGILLIGEILGEAAVLEKRYVGQSSSYGSEARGSACRADVVISDAWIDFPEVTEADLLACLSQGSYDRNKMQVNPAGGKIYIDSQLVKPDPASSLQHIAVPATEKAWTELNSRMAANMVLLGAVVKANHLVREESLRQALKNRVAPFFLDLNQKALSLGFQIGEEGA
jgi:2-oxoglutarate ferredoxin oxidoreductase subunit gamma